MSFSDIGTKGGVLQHYCNVQSGEALTYDNRQNIRIDTDLEDNKELYSGRVFHRNSNGLGVLGLPDNVNSKGVVGQLFVAHRGMDHPDINPWSFPGSEGLLSAPAMGPVGRGTISSIPLVEGLKLDTTEFVSDASGDYEIGERVYITDDGEWTVDEPGNNDGIAVGFISIGQPAGELEDDEDADYRLWELDIISIDISQIQYDLS